MGKTLIPFEPQRNVVAVAHDGVDNANVGKTLNLLASQTELFVLKPALDGSVALKKQTVPEIAIDNSAGPANIQLFMLKDDTNVEREIFRLQSELGRTARVGTPVNISSGQVAAIDRDFIVRFHEKVQAESIIAKAQASIVRPMVQASNTFHIRFRSGHPLDLLKVVESWHEQELLIYGEPDLFTEMTDDTFPYMEPDDPTYTNQANLTLQRIDEAWRRLADIDLKFATGRPSIHVATLDRGIDIDHPDLGAVLTDGTTQLSRCFDFSGMQECTVPGYQPDTSHGMGVYGIISAATDNNEDVAGIAANTHHIGLERP